MLPKGQMRLIKLRCEYMLWIILIVITVFFIIYYRGHINIFKNKKLMNSRDTLSDDFIYNRFYANSGLSKNSALDVWHEIANILHIPSGKMLPSDRFGIDIGIYIITSENLDALEILAKLRASKMNKSIDFSSIKTVNDYILQFANKLESSSD